MLGLPFIEAYTAYSRLKGRVFLKFYHVWPDCRQIFSTCLDCYPGCIMMLFPQVLASIRHYKFKNVSPLNRCLITKLKKPLFFTTCIFLDMISL